MVSKQYQLSIRYGHLYILFFFDYSGITCTSLVSLPIIIQLISAFVFIYKYFCVRTLHEDKGTRYVLCYAANIDRNQHDDVHGDATITMFAQEFKQVLTS